MMATRTIKDVLLNIEKEYQANEIMIVDTHFAITYQGLPSTFLNGTDGKDYKWLLSREIESYNPATNIIIFDF